MFEFKFGIGLFYFSFTFVSFRKSCLLVSWCVSDRCGIHTTMRIVTGVGDLVQRTGDSRTSRVLGGRAIERSGGVMCGLHRAHRDDEHGFLG
jgi:hypothetical protein